MTHARYLPGDYTQQEELEQMIRVNHAGEYGAQRIYAGQLAVLGNSKTAPVLRHMMEQEKEHLAYFEEQIRTRRTRPSLLHPLWHMGGFVLGAVTAKIGTQAAMACTVAVESVIGKHYAQQEESLTKQPQETDLLTHISRFRKEELEHHDIGLDHGAEEAPAYAALHTLISSISTLAIATAKRF